ncbi:TPA: hypothetical protein ACF33L_004687 [Escherichia coli]|nr:hypothetical protein [Shigella sonnei]SJC69863.1 Uncharacterised protein [Shigella sonnei]HAI2266268.1 hypothetical protein [Escherichia coli]
MKVRYILMMALTVLTLLTITLWQTFRLGQEDGHNRYTQAQLDDYSRTLKEAGTIISTASGVLRDVMTARQNRQQEGEIRREQLRNDITTDACARAVPDARFTERLHQHAERVRAAAVVPFHPGRADRPRTSPAVSGDAIMGKHRDMERPPSGCTGNL